MAMPSRGGIITCDIKDTQTLYQSYLSFVSGGGIFVPSERAMALGQDVFVVFTLPESSERYPINGKVVWLNHKSVGSRPAGFAVQLGKDPNAQKMRNEIERLLAGQTENASSTYTM